MVRSSFSYMTFNPFSTYKVEREPVEIDFLDEEELRKIINFDTPLPRLERAKDMFLFGCFTGLSYIDIKTLAPEHLTLSRILCKWKQDSVVSLFLYLDSVFKNKRLVSLGLLISLFPHVRKQFPVFF